MKTSILQLEITRFSELGSEAHTDILAVEEPLEIQLAYGNSRNRISKSISVTMRTPGNDEELALGFLFSEGIIQTYGEVEDIREVRNKHPESRGNSLRVVLNPGVIPDIKKLDRHFYTTSSCGVCGKTSLEAIETAIPWEISGIDPADRSIIQKLPATMLKDQAVFSQTGGLHASGLFDKKGNLIHLREDIGRHNAMDKLIGAALKNETFPLKDNIALVSGRVGFELVQKALMAGIGTLAAVGAPSSLAVKLARQRKINLIGFLRDGRFNVYSGEATG